jgi:hypothetical protein
MITKQEIAEAGLSIKDLGKKMDIPYPTLNNKRLGRRRTGPGGAHCGGSEEEEH